MAISHMIAECTLPIRPRKVAIRVVSVKILSINFSAFGIGVYRPLLTTHFYSPLAIYKCFVGQS